MPMALKTRVWGAGKLLVLLVALLSTYLVFAFGAARVALRAREVKVPELRGQSLNGATAALDELGLTLKVDESRRTDARVAAGHIAGQEPAPDTAVRRGRSVRVWVSTGPRGGRVPKLIGQTERTATLRLEQDGLSVSSISEIRSSDYPADAVVAQQPPPGSTGTRVALLINRAERGASYVMPDLIGVSGDRAADVLRSRGFRVTVVGRQPYPGAPAGVVLRQLPQAGFQVAAGDAISLEVSR
jgi:beta-lactam-binding protein with PASTA domain